MTISKKTQSYLDEQREMYGDYNQKERSGNLRMEALGHPFSADYRAMRTFFDQLKYACNASERFYSFKSHSEHSQYHAPTLDLNWHPTGIGQFGHIYPAHDQWNEYIQACADLGWPSGCTPSMDLGSWRVRTTDVKLIQDLSALVSESVGNCAGVATWGWYEGVNTCTMNISLRGPNATVERMKSIEKMIKKAHGRYVLPLRSDADELADDTVLSLSQKRLSYANVSKITETNRAILIPLVPLGAGPTVVEPLANELVELVKNGLPFIQARDWFKRFLTPSAFGTLQSRIS